MPVNLKWDWDLEIRYNPMELGDKEPYDLFFFIDSAHSSPSDWWDSPLRLFEPTRSEAPTTIIEYRYLNGHLEERSKDKLEDGDVVPWLREHLVWGVKKRYDDEKIENSRLKSLKISVMGPDGAIALSDKTSTGK